MNAQEARDAARHGGATDAGAAGANAAPSEEELRAAYEEELSRITSTDLMLQTAVSLLNLGARRLGLTGGAAGEDAAPSAAGVRDMEQVRDAIDGARALLDVLERRMPKELAPLRDALSQLQFAYAREAKPGTAAQSGATADEPGQGPSQAQQPGEQRPDSSGQPSSHEPGPAESSGRLWVPER
jgi:hypothetical protein